MSVNIFMALLVTFETIILLILSSAHTEEASFQAAILGFLLLITVITWPLIIVLDRIATRRASQHPTKPLDDEAMKRFKVIRGIIIAVFAAYCLYILISALT